MAPDADLYRRWIDELWGGRLEVVEELVTADFVGHWPDHDVHGPDGLARTIGSTRDMFDELVFDIEVGPVGDGALVAGRWRGRGTRGGEATAFLGNDILRVEQGRFAEYWVASMVLA